MPNEGFEANARSNTMDSTISFISHLPPLVLVALIGICAGAIAGLLMGRGLGLIGNLIVGILGGYVGNWLLPKLGLSFGSDLTGTIITSSIGAVVVLIVAGFVGRR